MRHYLATFTPGTREPHRFQASSDERAAKIAGRWAGVSELFRVTDLGYVRVTMYAEVGA